MKLPEEISEISKVKLPHYATIVYHAKMKKIYLSYDLTTFIDTEGIDVLKYDFLHYFRWRYKWEIHGNLTIFVVKTYKLNPLDEFLPVEKIKDKLLKLVIRQDERIKKLFIECKDEFLKKEYYVSTVLKKINSIFDCKTEVKFILRKDKSLEFVIKNVKWK